MRFLVDAQLPRAICPLLAATEHEATHVKDVLALNASDADVWRLALEEGLTIVTKDEDFADFVAAYNFGRRLKTLKGLTPYEHICKCWTSEPQRFRLDLIHHMPGLNI